MCTEIILLGGKSMLYSVGDVEQHFNINLTKYKDPNYKKLDLDQCLCQIDLNKLMSEEPYKYQFEYRAGHYEELPESERIDLITDKLQKECLKTYEKALSENKNVSYQDATNVWIFYKLAEFEARFHKLENK